MVVIYPKFLSRLSYTIQWSIKSVDTCVHDFEMSIIPLRFSTQKALSTHNPFAQVYFINVIIFHFHFIHMYAL